MQPITDRPRELAIRSGQDETRQALVSVTDCGIGIAADDCKSAVQRILHTKVQRPRYGALDLPFNRGSSRGDVCRCPAMRGPGVTSSTGSAPASSGCVMTKGPKSSHETAGAREPIVFVIDDDASVRRALTNLFQSIGLAVEVFGSAPELLHGNTTGCRELHGPRYQVARTERS